MEKLVPCLIGAAAVSGILTFFGYGIIGRIVLLFRRKGALARAEREGHVVTARRVDYKMPEGDDTEGRGRMYVGIYEYTVNGKTYRKRRPERGMPQEEITLYYGSNPAKAAPYAEFGGPEGGWLKVFLILFVLFFLLGLWLF